MTTARTQHSTRWHIEPESSGQSAAPLLPGLHPLVDRLLRARGVTDAEAAEHFLAPKLTHLHDPATLPGCIKAAQRLKKAVDEQQPIIIYGDYDVDGVTASAILYHTLTAAGASVNTYVPHRLEEGYGINAEAIRTLANGFNSPPSREEQGRVANDDADATKQSHQYDSAPSPNPSLQGGELQRPLIVSVDCGITATEPAALAKDLGVDLIITDHHEFDTDNLPEAYALVHPGLKEDQYPNRDLCGAGVAYKLAWQFALEYCGCEQGGKLPDTYRKLLLDLLAFAALGTVADVMPLVGENRAITTFGLQRISHTTFEGLNALIDASNLRSEKIDSYHIGFVLGPRLNACGRMGHAKEAVELLTTAQGERAKELAEQLHHVNEDRKATERGIVDQAKQMVLDAGYDRDDTRAIVLAHEDWHPGVVGIVASRIVEQFCRPVVLLCIDPATQTAKGSARSIDACNLHEAIQACNEHLTKFGGHAMAAGLSLPVANIDAFRDALVQQVNTVLKPEDLVQHVRIDSEVQLPDCTPDIFKLVQSLAPFGRGNPKPRLMLGRLTVDRAQRMGGQGRHLSMQLREGNRSIRAVAWSKGDLADQLPSGSVIDVVFQPAINEWRGNRTAELHVLDLQPHAS